MTPQLFGSSKLPMSYLPKALREAYSQELASRSAAIRLDDSSHITVFVPIFDAWFSPSVLKVFGQEAPKDVMPSWSTNAYHWVKINEKWNMQPKQLKLSMTHFSRIEEIKWLTIKAQS